MNLPPVMSTETTIEHPPCNEAIYISDHRRMETKTGLTLRNLGEGWEENNEADSSIYSPNNLGYIQQRSRGLNRRDAGPKLT